MAGKVVSYLRKIMYKTMYLAAVALVCGLVVAV